MVDLVGDVDLVRESRALAERILEKDPRLEETRNRYSLDLMNRPGEVEPSGIDMEQDITGKNASLQAKYGVTALFYDILDYPWERIYKKWRPALLDDIRGHVLEVGVGTGRNLKHYHESVHLVGVDLSKAMLKKAGQRAKDARCKIELIHDDATVMASQGSDRFDWVFSTFMCCVMPDELQPKAVEQFARVLKPGGRFKLLEMVFSKDEKIRKRQQRFAPFVEKVYGARFDRRTLDYLKQSPGLEVTRTSFLKDDVYLLIEGVAK